MGYNGAGKTTLISILLKLLSVEEGKVFFDGQDLARLNEREYQRRWGVVMQDFTGKDQSLLLPLGQHYPFLLKFFRGFPVIKWKNVENMKN